MAVATGVELSKLVLEQVLNLGRAALEDYVKDFFKDCIKSGVARANAEVLKKPMAEAVGFFIKRFIKELQINNVPKSSIEHHYKASIKRFIQNEAVRPVLGKAFEKDCQEIDYAELQRIWMQQYQNPEWQFPIEKFDWYRVAKEYVLEVQGIIEANAELRSLLEFELQKEIAENTKKIVENTTQLTPGFDLKKYRHSLQSSYGYLKLSALSINDHVESVKLWKMFIEPSVREAIPPLRYELPLDVQRQLQEQGRLEVDLSPKTLEHYRHQYLQQPRQKVLAALSTSQRTVILGYPGAGKSTLLQFIALEWAESKTEELPLLIELREYAIAQSKNFLDFLHRGHGADWKFDEKQLDQHLRSQPTLVMFDALDEVFDPARQSTVIDEIIYFAQQYPEVRVLITSRIIGYNPDRLKHAGFRHFTIQPLDRQEIHEFIDRWYSLALGHDTNRSWLAHRLAQAIAQSKPIQNLADNPLLLTMMAILNQEKELPSDRVNLYDQASKVLLSRWEVDYKRLQLRIDTIGRREKEEMLCRVAYEMQASEQGLKTNLITAKQLTKVVTKYLKDEDYSDPVRKQNR